MKKTLIAIFTMALALVVTTLTTNAADQEPDKGTYDAVMSTSLSKFYMKAQPNDAVALDIQVVLDMDDLGKSENGIYFNLPRLKNQYYYSVIDNSMWYVDEKLLYPSLSLKAGATSPADTQINLQIMSGLNQSVQANCTVTVLNQLTGTERISTSSYSKVKDGLTNENFKALTSAKTQLGAYNPELHKYALVTEKSVYVYDNAFSGWCNSEFGYEDYKAKVYDTHVLDLNTYYLNDSVKLVEYKAVGASGGDVDFRIRPYFMSSEGGLFVTDMSEYNQRTGILAQGASAQASYMLVNNNELILHEYNPDMDPAPENIPIEVKQGYSYTFNEMTKGHLAVLSTDAFQYYPSTNKYTAITGESMQLPLYAPGPTLLPFVVDMNGTGGDSPIVPPPEDKTYYTVRFDFTGGLRKSYQDVTPGTDPQLPTPVKKGYKFKGWYVDEMHTKLYDWRTFNYVLGGSYTLYADFELQGNYTVRFYDDKNGTDKTSSFSVGDLPTLPSTPTYTGYLFKNWMIVDNTASTTGTMYDPNTFRPSNSDTYIFKAVWDVQGVILKVTNQKSDYWVGDKVDKSQIVVLVQTDSNGTTKTLGVDEFTITPDKVEKVGKNTITIRYDATGATATVDVTGTADYVTGISAVYKGDDLEVGDAIPTGSIQCKLTYKSKKVVETGEFTINPSTVKSAGTNTITVTSSGFSTSITVNGKKKTADQSKNEGKGEVSTITASYTGKQLTVGDTIQGKDIKVTARFADGTTATVSNGDFTFSPSFVRNAGSNTITVSYQDKTCDLNIVGREKSSMTDGYESSTKDGATVTSNGSNRATGVTTVGATDGSGGYVANGKEDKGTSVGYLSGKNILDSLGSGTSSEMVNDVDILREINEAQKGAANVSVTLINTADGNYLTPEMVDALISKNMTLNVTLVSPKDKSSRVAYWTFEGKSMDSTEGFLDMNISFEGVKKKAETMYHVAVSDFPYQNSMKCLVVMKDAYPLSTLVNFYRCNYELRNSAYIGPLTWSNTLEVPLPVQDSNHFVFTDYAERYEDGSDLTTENADSLITEGEGDTEMDEDTVDDDTGEDGFDWGDDEEGTAPEPDKDSGKLKIFVIIAVVVLALAAIGGGTLVLLKSRAMDADFADDDDEFDDEDGIPAYSGEEIDDTYIDDYADADEFDDE